MDMEVLFQEHVFPILFSSVWFVGSRQFRALDYEIYLKDTLSVL